MDYDLIIKTIQHLIESKNANLNLFEVQAVSYCIMFLLNNEEFSVRDFAAHYVKEVLLKGEYGMDLVIEEVIQSNVKRIQDEMILKTNLDVLRHYIGYLKLKESTNALVKLSCLINLKDDNEDFFSMFLAIKMKTR